MKLTKKKARHVALVSVLVAMAGCTTDLISHHYDGDGDDPPAGSFPYALVRTKLAVSYTLQLTGCGLAPAQLSDPNVASIGVKVSAATAQTFEADPEQRYYIPTKHLTGLLKNTSLKITEGADQSLQGLNAEYADQTLQVAGAGLQAAASIAGDVLTGGVPVGKIAAAVVKPAAAQAEAEYADRFALRKKKKAKPKPAPAPVIQTGACTPDAAKKYSDYKTDSDGLPALVQASAAANPASDAKVSFETTKVANELNAITVTVVRTLTPKDTPEYVVVGKENQLEKFSEPMDLMTYVRTLWVDSSFSQKAVQISINRRKAILSCPADTAPAADGSYSCSSSPKSIARPDGEIDLYVARSTVGTAGHAAGASPASATGDQDADADGKIEGVRIRQPAVGFVRVCEGHCPEPDAQGIVVVAPDGPDFDTAPKTMVSVPQLGKQYRIKMHASVGDDVNVGFVLGPDGSTTSLSLTNNSTAAQGFSAVNSAATAYTAAVTAQNGAITAANGAVTAQAGLATTNANLATSAAGLAATNAQMSDTKLKAQADCLQQQKTIVQLGATPVTTCPVL
jgi:hypothetical protein